MSVSSSMSARNHYLGISLILLASMGFAIKGIFIKLAYAMGGRVDAVSLMTIRMLLSMPFFIAVAIFYSRTTTPEPMQRSDVYCLLHAGCLYADMPPLFTHS